METRVLLAVPRTTTDRLKSTGVIQNPRKEIPDCHAIVSRCFTSRYSSSHWHILNIEGVEVGRVGERYVITFFLLHRQHIGI